MDNVNKTNNNSINWVGAIMTIATGLLATGIYQLFAMSKDLIVIKEQAIANKETLTDHGKEIKEGKKEREQLERRIQNMEYIIRNFEDWRERQISK